MMFARLFNHHSNVLARCPRDLIHDLMRLRHLSYAQVTDRLQLIAVI